MPTPTGKATRIYRVTSPTGTHLVEAANPQRAIAHVARAEIKADIPSQRDVFELARSGVQIEMAGAETISDETRASVAQSVIQEV